MYKKYIIITILFIFVLGGFFTTLLPYYNEVSNLTKENASYKTSYNLVKGELSNILELADYAVIVDKIPDNFNKNDIYYTIEKNTTILGLDIDSIDVNEADEKKEGFNVVNITFNIKTKDKAKIYSLFSLLKKEKRLYVVTKYNHVLVGDEYNFYFVLETYYK